MVIGYNGGQKNRGQRLEVRGQRLKENLSLKFDLRYPTSDTVIGKFFQKPE
jgi:hypothetical protein